MPHMQQEKASKKLNQVKEFGEDWDVKIYADEKFMTGDTVYYRRQNCKGWHSPAKVLGREGQYVLIRHGRAFYRMHPCHLMKANKEFGSPWNEGNKTAKKEINEVLQGKKMKDSGIKIFISTGRNWKTTVKNQEEAKLWNIKWKEVMSEKQERLSVHSLNRLENIVIGWIEYQRKKMKIQSVSIGIMLIRGENYYK